MISKHFLFCFITLNIVMCVKNSESYDFSFSQNYVHKNLTSTYQIPFSAAYSFVFAIFETYELFFLLYWSTEFLNANLF